MTTNHDWLSQHNPQTPEGRALQDSLNASHRAAQHEQRRREEHERQDLLRRDLRDKYMTAGMPEAVSDRLFEWAWQEGHSAGSPEVEMIYADLKDVVNAAFRAGRAAARSGVVA